MPRRHRVFDTLQENSLQRLATRTFQRARVSADRHHGNPFVRASTAANTIGYVLLVPFGLWPLGPLELEDVRHLALGYSSDFGRRV